MMYVVKINNYYVKSIEFARITNSNKIMIGDILLSKEMMRNFDKDNAYVIAKEIGGEVVEIPEEVSCNDA